MLSAILLLPLLLLAALQLADCRHIQHQVPSRLVLAATDFSGLHLPGDPVFQDPWVKANIAVTYGHQVQDGIGSQTLRMLAVYGLASSLGIRHVFRPLGCVGHIGRHVHYREAACNFTNEADKRQLSKAQRMIDLPTTAPGNTSHWQSKFLQALDWTPFVRDVTDALKKQQPTLFEIERVNQLVRYHPDIFLSVPVLRPASPPPVLTCRKAGSFSPLGAANSNKSWLLDALRVAVHIRRGDVVTDNWHKRILKASYFINIAKTITDALEQAGCNYSVEVFIEAPANQEGAEELQLLRTAIPNAVLLVDTDMLWTWQMMATADVLVMSNSMFSLSAALLNPNALTIHVPYNHYSQRVGMFKMKHWVSPLDENGTLPDAAGDAIRQRTGGAASAPQQQQQV
ncbi:hypothetical protein COO60DRAFT_167155 [Scenedesmus sp. NREL 46B-D3]|nr:hypothetical protein COO60DRAFT_167155 [Scenedesmus sp. NREL 46B-D3]